MAVEELAALEEVEAELHFGRWSARPESTWHWRTAILFASPRGPDLQLIFSVCPVCLRANLGQLEVYLSS